MSLVVANEQCSSIISMYRTIKNLGIDGYNLAKTIVQPGENQTVQARALELGKHILVGASQRGSCSAICATLGAAAIGLASLTGRATPGVAATAMVIAGASAIEGAVGHILLTNKVVRNDLNKARSSVPFTVGTVALGVLASATITGSTKGALISHVVTCLMIDAYGFASQATVNTAGLGLVAAATLGVFKKISTATEVGGVLLGVLSGFVCSDFCNIPTRNPYI